MAFSNLACQFQGSVTLTLVDESITIASDWSVLAISVLNKNDSTSDGIFNGGSDLPEYASEDITIAPGGSRWMEASVGCLLVGQVIESPDNNCELEVILMIAKPQN